MESLNLSKLVLSDSFLELLKDEDISFDAIYTDNETLASKKEVKKIDGHLETFFSSLDKRAHNLFILDVLGINDILPYLGGFSSIVVLSSFSLVSSFTKKFHPEVDHLEKSGLEEFSIEFPWDLECFIKALKKEGKVFIPLSNQEISENIFASSNDSEEGISYVDKSLIDNKNIISLLSPEKADLCLFWMGNHFEELVKLSQVLAVNPARISLHILNQWNLLFSEAKEYYKDAKKIWIIIDHDVNTDLENKMRSLWKEVVFITPHYEKLRSVFAEYQFEEVDFNALALYERVLECL